MNCPHGCCGAAVITKKCGDHEIFITKIFNYGIFSNFTKILNHENLELYGICCSNSTITNLHSLMCARLSLAL